MANQLITVVSPCQSGVWKSLGAGSVNGEIVALRGTSTSTAICAAAGKSPLGFAVITTMSYIFGGTAYDAMYNGVWKIVFCI